MPVYELSSDQQLASAARDGDLGAWEAFMRRHGQRLLAFCTRMSGDETWSRAVWVQVFGELWQKRASARGGKLSTTLFSLATSHCATAASSRLGPEPTGDPASLELRSARLRRSLLEIPVRPRAALCLCYFDNVSFEEAERCLGAASGEARQLCAEGYEALTRSLGPGFLNEGLA
jgi:DNA-directed RNA polymerase specialized sigma24 family protein